MKKLCLLLIPIVAVLSSCAEVPDNIKTNSKASDSDTVSAADSYISVGDSVDGASKEIKDSAFDNITVMMILWCNQLTSYIRESLLR